MSLPSWIGVVFAMVTIMFHCRLRVAFVAYATIQYYSTAKARKLRTDISRAEIGKSAGNTLLQTDASFILKLRFQDCIGTNIQPLALTAKLALHFFFNEVLSFSFEL